MQNRIIGYDLARALAVFGMVLVNFTIVLCMGATKSDPDWLLNLIGLIEGRAAATFVVLAGVGISLFSFKGRTQNDAGLLEQNRRALQKRGLFLFVVGLLYTPIWPADILHFYGIYIALAALLISTPTRRLWGYIGLLVSAFVLMLFIFDYETGWDWSSLSYDRFWTPSGLARHMFFNGFHPVVPWLAFVLLGMIIGRQDMKSPLIRRRVFIWGAGAAISAELVSRFLIRKLSYGENRVDQEAIAAIFGSSPMPPSPFYMLAGGGIACCVIAASVDIGERYGDSAWLRPFVATGQLALTLYVGHVVVGMGTLEAIGRLQNQTHMFALVASILFCMAGVTFAHLWRRRFNRGPLEAAMRVLTQPLRPSA